LVHTLHFAGKEGNPASRRKPELEGVVFLDDGKDDASNGDDGNVKEGNAIEIE